MPEFDKECKLLKEEIIRYEQKLKRKPSGELESPDQKRLQEGVEWFKS